MAAVAVVVFFATVVGFRAETYFSSTGFCVKCHSMRYVYEELEGDAHFGPPGVDPECGDCHLPAGALPRMWAHVEAGVRDVIAEVLHDYSTLDAFNERRAELAHRARVDLWNWRSSPCKTCHKNPRGRSAAGRSIHRGRGDEDLNCIECHQGITHASVPPEDIERGIEEGRIVPK